MARVRFRRARGRRRGAADGLLAGRRVTSAIFTAGQLAAGARRRGRWRERGRGRGAAAPVSLSALREILVVGGGLRARCRRACAALRHHGCGATIRRAYGVAETCGIGMAPHIGTTAGRLDATVAAVAGASREDGAAAARCCRRPAARCCP